MKSKIVCKQENGGKETTYKVVSLTNRTTPYIGDSISEKEVQNLLRDSRGNLTVEIKGSTWVGGDD